MRAVTSTAAGRRWSRDDDELTIIPRRKLPQARAVHHRRGLRRRAGAVGDAEIGLSGFIPTDDGTVVAGQPDAARRGTPRTTTRRQGLLHVPDHRPGGPRGGGQRRARRASAHAAAIRPGRGTRTSRWRPTSRRRRSASSTSARTARRHPLLGRDRPGPVHAAPPRTGAQYAISQKARRSLQAARRTISVPAGGASSPSGSPATPSPTGTSCSSRRTRPARMTGRRCPTSTGTRATTPATSCPCWHGLHPFLAHYQTDNGDDTCEPDRHDRRRGAASGASDGYEQWRVDLSPYAGSDVEVSISYASDDLVQRGAWSSTTSSAPAAPARPRSRTTATRSTAGPSPARPRAARQRERLDRRHLRGRAADHRRDRGAARSRGSRRSSRSCRASSGRTRSRPPAGSSTTSRASASRSRRRRGPSTRAILRTAPSGRRGGRARARAPVGRRQPRARALAAHLAQRGLRDVHGVAVERARGPRHRAGDLRLFPAAIPPTTRSGPWSSATRGRTWCSTRRLRPRRMTLHALRLESATRTSSASCAGGRVARRWQRHDAPVHPPRRADLRPGLDAFFETWLFTPGEAAGDRARGCALKGKRAPRATCSAPSRRRGSASQPRLDPRQHVARARARARARGGSRGTGRRRRGAW